MEQSALAALLAQRFGRQIPQSAPSPGKMNPRGGYPYGMSNAGYMANVAPPFEGIPAMPTPSRNVQPESHSDRLLMQPPYRGGVQSDTDRFDPNLMEGIGEDPFGMYRFEDAKAKGSFQPGAEYQTADMTGIKPAGVGQEAKLQASARAYQTLMKGLDEYETLFKDGGHAFMPGARNDTLATAHRDLQMQMKELYNLGVLNGPDLMLMDQILLDPTSVSGGLMDMVGLADMEERIPNNIKHVRRMMTNLVEPSLQQLGMTPADLQPKSDPSQMSDEELLKALTGG